MDLQWKLISEKICNKTKQIIVKRRLYLRGGEMKRVFEEAPDFGVC